MLAITLTALACMATGCLAHHSGPLPGEPDATYTQIDDTRVRYVDTGGDGAPVVLIHGFAASLGTWSGVIPHLEPNHRVIALDLKGFGWTDRPEGDYDPDTQAQLVFGLLDELGVDQTAVVAHSWGSSVALAMAHLQPERVERIALYDAWVYEEQLPVFFHWSRLEGLGEVLFALFYKERPADKLEGAFYDSSVVPQSLVDEVEEALDRPGAVAAALAAVRGQDYSEIQKRYPSVTQPTLLLWGREDGVTTLDFGERLYTELPNAELVVYPQCGHFPMIEAYWPSTRELVAFLAADHDGAAKPATPGDAAESGPRKLEAAPVDAPAKTPTEPAAEPAEPNNATSEEATP
jgi:pimeloyl-ACP methyl ester carboxylesterase